MSPKPGSVHLLISCFGLWGEGKHLKPTEDLILKAWEKEEKKHAGDRQVDEFILLDPEVNASMKTLDGIDLVSFSWYHPELMLTCTALTVCIENTRRCDGRHCAARSRWQETHTLLYVGLFSR